MFDNTQLHVCYISTVVGGLIFCISATPQPGCLFPLFHGVTAGPGSPSLSRGRVEGVESVESAEGTVEELGHHYPGIIITPAL